MIIVKTTDRVPTVPSHYELIRGYLQNDLRIDIKDTEAVFRLVKEHKPDFIFHLSAQPIVLESYKNPLNTFNTNTIGTADILDALCRSNHKCTAE